MRQQTVHPSEGIQKELNETNAPDDDKGEDKDKKAVHAQSNGIEVLDIDTPESETEGIPEKSDRDVEPKNGKAEEERSKRSVSRKSQSSDGSKASKLIPRSPDSKAEFTTSSEEEEEGKTSKDGPRDSVGESERQSNYKSDIRSTAKTGNLGRSFARSSVLSIGRHTSGERTTKNDTFRYKSRLGERRSFTKTHNSRRRRSRTTKNARSDRHGRDSARGIAMVFCLHIIHRFVFFNFWKNPFATHMTGNMIDPEDEKEEVAEMTTREETRTESGERTDTDEMAERGGKTHEGRKKDADEKIGADEKTEPDERIEADEKTETDETEADDKIEADEKTKAVEREVTREAKMRENPETEERGTAKTEKKRTGNTKGLKNDTKRVAGKIHERLNAFAREGVKAEDTRTAKKEETETNSAAETRT